MTQVHAQDVLEMTDYCERPRVLLLADDPALLSAGEAAAMEADLRVVGCEPLSAGSERLERQIALDAVWIGLGEGSDGASLLQAIAQGAAMQRFGAVVAMASDQIDLAARLAWHDRIELLCDPSPEEEARALRRAAQAPDARLHDIGRNGHTPRLQELSREVKRIATILADLSDEENRAPAETSAEPGAPIDAGGIRAMIRARRLRDQHFAPELFADPAWDMLLDLMAARLEQRRVAVSILCIAAAVPPTTALRWIKTLTDQGLFVRRADPQDGRTGPGRSAS